MIGEKLEVLNTLQYTIILPVLNTGIWVIGNDRGEVGGFEHTTTFGNGAGTDYNYCHGNRSHEQQRHIHITAAYSWKSGKTHAPFLCSIFS